MNQEIKDEAMKELKKRYSDFTCGAKVIQVIESRVVTGKGTEDDPMRPTIVYRSLDGELLAVYDPCFNYVS